MLMQTLSLLYTEENLLTDEKTEFQKLKKKVCGGRGVGGNDRGA